jgi:type I restriction enzyme M protein
MANVLRAAGIDPANYRDYVLPLLMYKVVCDRTLAEKADVVAEFDEETWDNFAQEQGLATFVVPPGADFTTIRSLDANRGERLTDALIALQDANESLAGVFLGTDYGKLTDRAVDELLATLGELHFAPSDIHDDALGAAFEYLLGKFADAAGAKAGQFFTPPPVAKLLALLVAPKVGDSVFDPTCGSAGLLNQVAQVVADTGAARGSVALYGQELNEGSAALAKVNLFLHSDQGRIAQGDTLAAPAFVENDQLMRFECVVANPPFGQINTVYETWASDRYRRFRWGSVVRKPSELAFVAHMASSLKGMVDDEVKTGRAAIVLPMGALFRKGVEADMRKRLLEANLVDAVIALPGNLFYNTSIPAAILVLRAEPREPGKVLFVDATTQFVKAKKQNVLTAGHLGSIVASVTTRTASGDARVAEVSVDDLVAADADLSVSRWLPIASSVDVDVPAALHVFRQAQRLSAESEKALWGRIEEAGYEID